MKKITQIAPNQSVVDDVFSSLGKAQNVTRTGDGTGTPLTAELYNNFLISFPSALLKQAGLTPNGVDEKAQASQVVVAIKKLITQEFNS